MNTNTFKHISLLLSASAFLGMASCADSVVESIDQEESGNVQLVKNINADVEAFEIGDEQTRSLYKEVENGYQFVWQEHDMIGVWGIEKLDGTPCEGPINFMRVQEGAGSSTVKFDGGDWALRSNTKYLAYYPFEESDLTDEYATFDRTSRTLSYTGQVVDSHEPMAHLSQYDYITTEQQTADANGNINFKFNHLGSLYCFKFKFPRGTEVTSISLNTKNPTYSFNSEIMVNEYGSIAGSTSSQTFSLTVNGSYKVDNKGEICLYAMISGDDQTDINISGVVNTNKGFYSFTEKGKKNTPGKMYVIERDWLTNYSAILLDGPEFSNKMADFVTWATSSTRHDYHIKKIYFRHVAEGDLPSSPYSFAAEGSKHPIVGRYTKETDVLEILTTADEIFFTGCKYMFSSCLAVQNIDFSIVNTSKVKNFSFMFEDCKQLASLDLSGFDTSSATTMCNMFNNCSNLTSLDLSGFDTSATIDMSWMFNNCNHITSLDLRSFDTSNVLYMQNMFSECTSLKALDISSFNTSKVKKMHYMFNSSALDNINLTHFDTSNVDDMNHMFANATTKNFDIRTFNMSNVIEAMYMFANCEFSFLEMDNVIANDDMICAGMFEYSKGNLHVSDELYNYLQDNNAFYNSDVVRMKGYGH